MQALKASGSLERVGQLEDRMGHLCLVPEEMGKILNELFASVFTKKWYADKLIS